MTKTAICYLLLEHVPVLLDGEELVAAVDDVVDVLLRVVGVVLPVHVLRDEDLAAGLQPFLQKNDRCFMSVMTFFLLLLKVARRK